MPLALIASVYMLAWGPLLFTIDGVWWDDWTLIAGSPDGIQEMFSQNGHPWIGWLHVFLFPLGPVGYHLLSFLLFLFVGFLLWGILGSFQGLGQSERLFVATIFLVLPLNAARNTMIVLPYTISLAVFFLAWYLLTGYRETSVGSVFAASFLFFISFSFNSLLVFFVVPISHFWWLRRTERGQTTWPFVRAYWPMLSLPFGYYLVKVALFSPYGAYEDYNSLTRRGLVIGLSLLVLSGLPFVVMLFERFRISAVSRDVWLFGFGGALLLAIAVFPYVVVGRIPPGFEWQTRDQILMPLGVGVILLATTRLITFSLGPKFAACFAALVVAVSVVLAAQIGYDYRVDWRKQQAIVDILRNDESMQAAQLVVFHDLTTEDNIFGTPYRFYAWNGLMLEAFGQSTRFGLNPSDIPAYLDGNYRSFYGSSATLDYGASGFVESMEATVAVISKNLAGHYILETETIPMSELYTVERTAS